VHDRRPWIERPLLSQGRSIAILGQADTDSTRARWAWVAHHRYSSRRSACRIRQAADRKEIWTEETKTYANTQKNNKIVIVGGQEEGRGKDIRTYTYNIISLPEEKEKFITRQPPIREKVDYGISRIRVSTNI